MNPTLAFNDFPGLLADLEGSPTVWEKENLFLALSYRPRAEIPAGLSALAKCMKKNLEEVSAEFLTYQIETARQRRGSR